MGTNATSLAVVRNDGLVETFVTLDIPDGWTPPAGYTLVPDDELPENWERVPAPLPPVPKTISARQIRLWLIKNDYTLEEVESAINNIADIKTRNMTRVEWEYAPYVERTHPMLIPLAAALGLTEAQVDQAFRDACQM